MEKPRKKGLCKQRRQHQAVTKHEMLFEFMSCEGQHYLIILCQDALETMQLCSLPEQLGCSLFLFN